MQRVIAGIPASAVLARASRLLVAEGRQQRFVRWTAHELPRKASAFHALASHVASLPGHQLLRLEDLQM